MIGGLVTLAVWALLAWVLDFLFFWTPACDGDYISVCSSYVPETTFALEPAGLGYLGALLVSRVSLSVFCRFGRPALPIRWLAENWLLFQSVLLMAALVALLSWTLEHSP